MKIPCHVKDGRPNNAKKLNEAFRAFEGKDVIVTIEKRKSKRSEQQNKYYWACVIEDERACIKEQWGELWSKLHPKMGCGLQTFYFKYRFLPNEFFK